jgi:hypothetical protein
MTLKFVKKVIKAANAYAAENLPTKDEKPG